MNNKKLALVAISIVLVQFLYVERDVLTPFILAAIFAYIFNTVVDAAAHRLRLPRLLSVFLIYIVLLGALALVALVVGNRLLSEIKEITKGGSIDSTAQSVINSLPSIDIAGQSISLQDYANRLLDSLKNGSLNIQSHAQPIFSGAIHQAVNVIVFFVASIYILRDRQRMQDYLIKLFPESSRAEARQLWNKISKILGAYLRGQLILVAIMASVTFICLEILGVRYALILAILSGFLEIIPYVGPITAAATAAGVSFLNGQNRFDLDPTTLALIILGLYFVLRHLEDYLVIPLLYERLTRLHPLVVIFAVLTAGHLFGLIGLIIAVPVAASLKVLIEYIAERPSTAPAKT